MPNKQQLHKNSFPLKSDNIQNLTSYLQIHRKIPSEVINLLIQENLLYQSYDSLYAVFINRKNNYAERQFPVCDPATGRHRGKVIDFGF